MQDYQSWYNYKAKTTTPGIPLMWSNCFIIYLLNIYVFSVLKPYSTNTLHT